MGEFNLSILEEAVNRIKVLDALEVGTDDYNSAKENLEKTLGITKDQGFTIDSDGKITLNGTPLEKLDAGNLQNMLNDPNTNWASGMKSALNDREIFPTETPTVEQENNTVSKIKSKLDVSNPEKSFGKVVTQIQDAFVSLGKEINFKYLIVGGLSYGALILVGKSREGCYISRGEGQEVQITNSTDKSVCTCGNNIISCQQKCTDWVKASTSCAQLLCSSTSPSTSTHEIKLNDSSSICKIKSNDPHSCQCYTSTEADSGLKIIYKKEQDPVTVLSGALASIGYFITDIENDVVKLTNAATNAAAKILKLPVIFAIIGGIALTFIIIYFLIPFLKKFLKKKRNFKIQQNLTQ